MAVTIQIRRGAKAGLPALAPGEYGLTTDTKELYVGGLDGNIQIATVGSDGKIPESLLPDLGGYVQMESAIPAGERKKNTLYGLILANYGGDT